MKKSLFIILLCTAFQLHAQWITLNSPTNTHLYSTYFTSHDTGYAVGGDMVKSVFLKTINGGVDWNLMTNTQTKWLYDVLFLNDSTGLACGYDGAMYKTTNAGVTWEAKASETTEWLYAMSAKTPDTIFAVGSNGKVIRSDNAGNNWTNVVSNTNRSMYDVHFYNNQYGAAVGEMGEMIYTTDGGNNWGVKLMGTINSITGVWMLSPEVMWACGYSGELYYTGNGGASFILVIGNPAGSDTINRDFNAIRFVDDQIGYITGDRMILQTSNGGVTWHYMNYPNANPMNDIFVTDDNVIGYTVGENGNIFKNVNTIGVEELENNQWKVYPNPSNGVFYLPELEEGLVEVLDLQGKLIRVVSIGIQDQGKLDLTGFPNGQYILRIHQGKDMGYSRITLQY